MSSKNSAWRSPWVIGWIAIVLVVLIANGVMIYIGVSSHPGLVTKDYYERGQDYEATMLARRKKAAGLDLQLDIAGKVLLGQPVTVRFSGTDRDGVPLEADAATVFVYRPADAARDFSRPMAATGPGRFEAELVFPARGIWDLIVSVRRGEEEFNTPRRVIVQPD